MPLHYAASFEAENMLTVFMWPVKKRLLQHNSFDCCNCGPAVTINIWTSQRAGGKKPLHGGEDLSFCGAFKDFLSRLILVVELISLTIVPSRCVP